MAGLCRLPSLTSHVITGTAAASVTAFQESATDTVVDAVAAAVAVVVNDVGLYIYILSVSQPAAAFRLRPTLSRVVSVCWKLEQPGSAGPYGCGWGTGVMEGGQTATRRRRIIPRSLLLLQLSYHRMLEPVGSVSLGPRLVSCRFRFGACASFSGVRCLEGRVTTRIIKIWSR